ncbi:PREDICTED: uncharacterized protein LOC108782270 [Cyphomyrmex costatus]|uniref:uncharacterized protein LOC108782270 n=1 Tax=Cyphomyrmex costatus TaxID=456900 RepID=UPI0008523F01|nr:PREDICTED: uncharacterized protein LOC108782270 [Cyphomyrmex costatus]
MILDLGISSSDTKIKDDHEIRNSKIKMLYLGMLYFVTNFLSSIALEAGSRNLFRSISTRPAIFNNIFRRNYNLRIKVMIGDVLAALISTMMLTIGDIYGIPYLYLPWLINTIEGMIFHEGKALFGLAYTMLPNVDLSTGIFMFITLLLYVEELCIWKYVFMNFKHCWTRYNNKLKKDIKSMSIKSIANNELCNKAKESLNENIVLSKSTLNQQNSATHFNVTDVPTDDIFKPVEKIIENSTSIINRRSKSLFTEVTG